MLFNSYQFIFLFLPVCWGIYFTLNHFRLIDLSKTWLLISSLFFYGLWDLHYFPLILLSIVVNYTLALQALNDKNTHRKDLILRTGLIFNIGLLCYFKYANFFLDSFNLPFGKIFLPLGLSFYTLQQIAYLVDVHQGIAGEKKFLDYALFVGFFPHVISGPIVHYEETLPQFKSLRLKILKLDNVALGIFLFSMGLFKKVIMADSIAVWVNEGYQNSEQLHFFSAWGTSLGYTLQLYFDFSGYTDMAVGLGSMFNIRLPQNFNSPLRAGNINEFWSRWHITLTVFIRTYIFTPLVRVMPKANFYYSMWAMVIAMTIVGIWHGAAWTFVIYGLIHGLAIVVHHNWKKRKKKLPYFLGALITFNFVNLSFILFRARSLKEAMNIYSGMLGLKGLVLPKMGIGFLNSLGLRMGPYMTNEDNLQLAYIVVGFIIICKGKSSFQYEKEFKPDLKYALFASALFIVSFFGLNRVSEFIYFNF